MSMNVVANGRSILHKGHGMTHVCAVPDVCKTPTPGGPVPIPYINVAMDSNITDGAKSVKIEGNPVANTGSKISTSMGDEPGTVGGIISSKFKGTVTWKMGSLNVKAEGKSVVRFLDAAFHNGNTFNTAFINVGSPKLAYGDDEPCEECNEPYENHRVHATDEAHELADGLLAAMNKIYEEQEMDLLEAFRARSTARVIGQERQALAAERAQMFEGMSRAARRRAPEAAPYTTALAELDAWQRTWITVADVALARIESRYILRMDDNTNVYSQAYMVGICVCKCGKKNLAACSGRATPGFIRAADVTGYDLVENMPDLSERQRNVVAASPRVANWDCAAPKLINALDGHKPRLLIEFWYEKNCSVATEEVRYQFGDRRRIIRQQLARFNENEGVAVNPVRRYDGDVLVSEQEETFQSGDSVPSCEVCQSNLPELLCDAQEECP